ncbi:hypothetical protein [Salinibacter phage M8CRM-1]|uniref:Uncharacterized protein n=1 Tax=Salinibacter phage M8CRM-1 TaxID=2681612 RepID=A0A2I6UGY5_9CAUD|nr:hypothetical protein FGG67_gp35 [Salinibacter phage M8CRM-1]AUO79177.1 hypothetical protein [Salinibacter phage M8CRM-1]
MPTTIATEGETIRLKTNPPGLSGPEDHGKQVFFDVIEATLEYVVIEAANSHGSYVTYRVPHSIYEVV